MLKRLKEIKKEINVLEKEKEEIKESFEIYTEEELKEEVENGDKGKS